MPVAVGLASALDDWAAIRHVKRAKAPGAARLPGGRSHRRPRPQTQQGAPGKPWINPTSESRLNALEALAKTANFDELGPISLHLLGTGLNYAGDSTLSESVLRRAQQRFPGDVWVNHALGGLLARLSRSDEAIRFYTAARAIRPDSAHDLAHELQRRGDSDEALAVFRDLESESPGNASHLGCLGGAPRGQGAI